MCTSGADACATIAFLGKREVPVIDKIISRDEEEAAVGA